jgi:hypothetical protein
MRHPAKRPRRRGTGGPSRVLRVGTELVDALERIARELDCSVLAASRYAAAVLQRAGRRNRRDTCT